MGKMKKGFAIFLAGYFLVAYAMALSWTYAGYFSAYDVIFDADPNTNLRSFVDGWGGGRNALTHPLIEFLALPPQAIGFFIRLVRHEEVALGVEKMVALAYAPFFLTLALFFYAKILRALKLEGIDLLIAFAAFSLCFSALLFSIVVETYAISCALIAALLYLYMRSPHDRPASVLPWLMFSVLLPGITITNAGVYLLVYSAHLRRAGWTRIQSLVRASILAILGAGFALVVQHLSLHFTGAAVGAEGGRKWLHDFSSFSVYGVFKRLIHLSGAMLNTYVAASPNFNGASFSFLRRPDQYWLITATIMLELVIVAVAYRCQKDFGYRPFFKLLTALVVFNVLLHTFFGYEMFLYSLHWAIPLTLLLTPLLLKQRGWSTVGLVCMATINLAFIASVDSVLKRH
jgi:hypothetical protein